MAKTSSSVICVASTSEESGLTLRELRDALNCIISQHLDGSVIFDDQDRTSWTIQAVTWDGDEDKKDGWIRLLPTNKIKK